MKRILFPTAKFVDRELQSVGKIPAILYPIDQRCMLDIYIEQYFTLNQADTFEIISYEGYEMLQLRTPKDRRIHLHKLDRLEDLGYTIWYCLKHANITENDIVIINFADVVLFNQQIDSSCNKIFYSLEPRSSKWTFFQSDNGKVLQVYDHLEEEKKILSDKMFVGLFYIKNPKQFLRIQEESLKLDHKEDSFYTALCEYSKVEPFEMVYADEWFDIGHLDKYYDTCLEVKSRTFNHIIIDKNRGILTKTSENKDKFIGEIKWYLKLPNDLEYVRPRIFSYSCSYLKPYIAMEYYAYHTLHELFLYGELSIEQWVNIFKRIQFILKDFQRYKFIPDVIQTDLNEMYIEKTLTRMKSVDGLLMDIDFYKPVSINGVMYHSLWEICKQLPEIIKKTLMNIDTFTIIHGDLCFSNILVDPSYSFVKLIDPRGGFGKCDIYGDYRYELAKLLHSVEGKYDYIIKDLFTLKCKENTIDFHILERPSASNICKTFKESFIEAGQVNLSELRLIESLLFFSMIPLHKENKQRQVSMLSTAIELLNKVFDIRE